MAIDKSGKWWVGTKPQDIEQYLRELNESEDDYPITAYRAVKCSCRSIRFHIARAGDISRRTCAACHKSRYICRDLEDWEEAEDDEGVEVYSCVECNSKKVNIGVGFAGYEDPNLADAVKWHYVGVRCAECGILSGFNDGKIAESPASEVFKGI